ncbi:MAG: 5-formyltetrahydrofolate cyclo-ligase [Gammaproteobacteria bacterium]|nr:MAG: 5-formyltetrahydrofolate cyclo-ligase [Gammaproteobacteria bacterium]
MTSQVYTQLKQQLREQTRNQRQQLSVAELEVADRQLAAQCQSLNLQQHQKIAVYLQHDNEIGTRHIIEWLFAEGCELYLPRLFADGSNQLQFCHYHSDSEMKNNRFGIAEPLSDKVIAANKLDLIFLPLTAFDLLGNRIGMGGGFYDRTLENIANNKTVLAGLAYDFQQLPECPVEPFDQSLNMILTPTRVIDFSD